MQFYLDTSVALHALLPGGDRRARSWLDGARTTGDEVFSSTLLGLEVTRVLRREGIDLGIARSVVDRINQVSISDGVLRFAGSLEPHLKSLDAIHLATGLLLGSGAVVVTHDRGMQQACDYLDVPTLDPIATDGGPA